LKDGSRKRISENRADAIAFKQGDFIILTLVMGTDSIGGEITELRITC